MISILTPIYNRAYIINNLYQSLLNQTDKMFEWVIIDDGSNDNLKSVVNNWIIDNKVNIKYFYQKNQGKHIAINTGAKICESKYICIVDSDDYLIDNAVEKIRKRILEIDDKDYFSGIAFCKGNYVNGKLINMGKFPANKKYIDASDFERVKKNLTGEKLEVVKKELLIKYAFPKFEDERFLSEGVLWGKLSLDNYKMRWYPEVLCVCEYLEDGLTLSNQNKLILDNFKGFTYFIKTVDKYKPGILKYIRIGIYIYFARIKNISIKQIKNNLEISNFDLVCSIPFYLVKKVK